MSRKKKSGLQRGLSDIVEAQTAPRADKSAESASLIDKFRDAPEPLTLSTQSTNSTQSTHPAPMRDFHKVANSIAREAVPAGVFKGKCKQLYDFLYLKTRGAVVATRSATLTRKQIMAGAGIGSTKTLFLNLRHLKDSGLVTWVECEGTHGGNEYTVHLPEEAMSTHSTLSTQRAAGHDLPRVPVVETTQSTHGLTADYQRTSGEGKTLIPDLIRSDDEAAPASKQIPENFEVFASAIESIDAASKQLTGKGISKSDASKWLELFEVLSAELRIAAARTTVSNVPAFLAEHLRRRLWKLDKKQAAEKGIETPDKTPAAASESPQDCPTCFGAGWEYPNGPDGGVRKCKHGQLSS